MKQQTEYIEIAHKYRIKYESAKGREQCIKDILSDEYWFMERFGKECSSFHPVKGRKGRRVIKKAPDK